MVKPKFHLNKIDTRFFFRRKYTKGKVRNIDPLNKGPILCYLITPKMYRGLIFLGWA